MRTCTFIILAALSQTGCQKSDPKSTDANPPAVAAKPAEPRQLKLPPVPPPGAKTDAPKSGEKLPPVEPSPKLPPKVAPVLPAAASDELSAAITKLNGYESTHGRKPGDPIHYQFRSPGPTDADLEALRPLLLKSAAPVQLNLNQCASVTDAGVAHLKGVTALRGLSLGGTAVTDAGMKHIGGLTELTQLYIASDAITDAGVAHLSKLLKLRTLTITGKAITAAAFEHFADMTELEGVQAGGSYDFDDAKLKHMAKMTRLKTLSLAGPGLTDAGMASLKGMSELRELRIDGEKTTAAGVAHLAGLTKLQKLTVFKGPGFKGDALAALAGMKDLRELDFISAPSLDKAGGEHLGKLTGLKKLRLSGVAPDGLSGITAMTGLEELTLLYTDVNDDGLKHIGKHTGLKDLSLYATRVTDAGLAHLSGMTALRKLDLSENRQLTDAALVAAAAIPNLESLRVSNCTKITGTGLKNLAGHAKLKELWVNGDPVTDASALVLKNLKTLERLDLAGTKVSDEVAFELKAARPKARILDASSTEVSLDKPAPPRPTPKGEDLAKVDADFTLTAEAFQQEYAADQVAAEKKYKGKVIELSGTVQTVGRVGGTRPTSD